MAVTFVDVKGAVSNTLASALTGLTVSQTRILATGERLNATPASLGSGTGMVDVGNAVGPTISLRIGTKLATATTDNTGTWTNATVVRGIAFDGAGPISNFAVSSGSAANPSSPALTLSRTDGTSTGVLIGLHASGQLDDVATPSGWTKRDGGGSVSGLNTWPGAVTFTQAGMTSDIASIPFTLGAGNWVFIAVEVPDAVGGGGGGVVGDEDWIWFFSE